MASRPALKFPTSSVSVQVSMIDTTTDMVAPTNWFVMPQIKGQEYFNFPTFAFHIRHPSGKQVLFDLGGRKDWWNNSRPVVESIHNAVWGVNITSSINDILHEGGVDPSGINSIVLSHWHWDHVGDPSLFPKSTELVVGPGFKRDFMPGYPVNDQAPMLEKAFEGRQVREAPFTSDFKIGGFEAYDFFGDGSFYILNTPGHTVGHICALARTTADTFVFMGGDICHYGGMFRPTEMAPMPDTIPSEVRLDTSRFSLPCPCSAFTDCHPNRDNPQITPYYKVTLGKDTWYTDAAAAQVSIDTMEVFDADPNVFVCIAHDIGLKDAVTLFPDGNINDWKQKGMKQKSFWGFLNELPAGGKPGPGWRVPGLMKDGKLVEKSN